MPTNQSLGRGVLTVADPPGERLSAFGAARDPAARSAVRFRRSGCRRAPALRAGERSSRTVAESSPGEQSGAQSCWRRLKTAAY